MTHAELIAALEAATEPSRELDGEIAMLGYAPFVVHRMREDIISNAPRYTSSIDAALTLVPDEAFYFHVEWDDEPVDEPLTVSIMLPAKPRNIEVYTRAACESKQWKTAIPRLLCIAALKAREPAR